MDQEQPRITAMGSSVVDAARQSLGPVGVYLPVPFVAYGDPESIAATVDAHRAVGADHVILMPSATVDLDLMAGVGQLEHLASAVLQLR